MKDGVTSESLTERMLCFRKDRVLAKKCEECQSRGIVYIQTDK